MEPLISEASGQEAYAFCHRWAKSSVCRIGAEFKPRFGAYPCGIGANQTKAVPAFRRRVRGLRHAPRAESRPLCFDSLRLRPRKAAHSAWQWQGYESVRRSSPDHAVSKVLSVMHSGQSDPICHAKGNVSSGLFPDSEIPLSSPPFPRDTTTSATYPSVMCS